MILIGVLVIVFILVNGGFAFNLNRITQTSIARQFEREELLEQVRQQQQEAEEAHLAKSQFLAAVSHDLRQPLHAMDLFHSSLELALEKKEALELLTLAQSSSHALKEMLGELMDVARIDAGSIQPEREIISLDSLLQSVSHDMLPIAQQKQLAFRFRLPGPVFFDSDPVLLKRIIRNLLSNAINHTQTGGVLLGVHMRNGKASISIYDTGPGIAQDQIPHIFDEFYQVNNPERDREKGIGLGLAIVRRISDLLDHQVDVHSVKGRGSCFSVSVPVCLPIDDEWPEPIVETISDDVSGLFVFVVDDDRSILQGMRTLLLGWGCEILLAESKQELVDELVEYNYQPPDVIISDYRLRRGRNGLEVVEAVRTHFNSNTPAIIISGDIQSEVREQVAMAQCNWLEKPVQSEALKRMLSDLTAKKA